MMLSTHPLVRGIIYLTAITATVASLMLGELLPGEAVTRAVVLASDYLSGLAGVTALSHMTMNKQPLNKP